MYGRDKSAKRTQTIVSLIHVTWKYVTRTAISRSCTWKFKRQQLPVLHPIGRHSMPPHAAQQQLRSRVTELAKTMSTFYVNYLQASKGARSEGFRPPTPTAKNKKTAAKFQLLVFRCLTFSQIHARVLCTTKNSQKLFAYRNKLIVFDVFPHNKKASELEKKNWFAVQERRNAISYRAK